MGKQDKIRYNKNMDELKKNAKRLSPDQQYQIRKDVVRMLKKGMKPNDVAAALDVSRSLVYATKKTYDEEGIEGIRPKQRGRRVGDKRTLTKEQERDIIRTITDKNPEQLKLKRCMWTRRAIHDYILREHKIDMPLVSLGVYLRRWGFSVQRPSKRAAKQDELRVKAWMEDEYPEIVEKSRREGAEIYWGGRDRAPEHGKLYERVRAHRQDARCQDRDAQDEAEHAVGGLEQRQATLHDHERVRERGHPDRLHAAAREGF